VLNNSERELVGITGERGVDEGALMMVKSLVVVVIVAQMK